MFEFSVSKDMTEKKRGYNMGGGSREGSGTFIKELKISVA